jgi:hypothetical protein
MARHPSKPSKSFRTSWVAFPPAKTPSGASKRESITVQRKNATFIKGPTKAHATLRHYDRQQPPAYSKGKHWQVCGAENASGDTECLKPKGHIGRHRYLGIL